MTWKAAAYAVGGIVVLGLGMIASVFTTGYVLKAEIAEAAATVNGKVDTVYGNLNEKVTAVREDVAVIKYQVAFLSKASVQETQNVDQAQYVLVQLPAGDAELRDQRIRDIIDRQILIQGEK